jgi:uncharacterized membrane protein
VPSQKSIDRVIADKEWERHLEMQTEAEKRSYHGLSTVTKLTYYDRDRNGALVWLALGFVTVVLLIGRKRGARALLGLGLSFLYLIYYLVPTLMNSNYPVAVALTGAVIVLYLTVLSAHGPSLKAWLAILSSLVALGMTALLVWIFTVVANVDSIQLLPESVITDPGLILAIPALYIASVIIATLGVLDDLTITQVSTVLRLRANNTELSVRELYHEAMQVGYDHIGAIINTLALALLGSGLPIFILLSQSSLGEGLMQDAMTVQLATILIGSISLTLAMPLTTAFASLFAHEIGQGDISAEDTHSCAGHDHD